ncbi:hypothetical protein FRC01_005851, partial [Tulasnella sp. 417]
EAAESESWLDQPTEKERSAEPVSPPTGIVLPLTPPNSLPRHFSPPVTSTVDEVIAPPATASSIRPTPSLPPRPSPKVSESVSSSSPNVARLKEAWGTNKPIGAREVGPVGVTREPEPQPSNGPAFRRALPGLSVTEKSQVSSGTDDSGSKRRSVMEIARGMADAQPSPIQTPASRAIPPPAEEEEPSTPIDVRSAIANWGKSAATNSKPSTPAPIELPKSEDNEEDNEAIDVKSAIASWGRIPASPTTSSSPIPRPNSGARDPVKAERRRSQLHEKYASMILPPLAEEKTPAPTPVGTVRREASEVKTDDSDADTATKGGTPGSEGNGHRKQPSAFQMHQALLEHKALVQLVDHSPDESPAAPPPTSLPFAENEPIIRLAIDDTSNEIERYDLGLVKDVIYIDQVEPERKNLCSAFAYVSTVLEAVYVFQGRGASSKEREQAVEYAKTLCAPNASPIEFEEDAEDEMFSMVLGAEEHARADFWRFRNVVDDCLVRLYRVHSASQPKVQLLNEVAAECIDPSAVFVLDGTFELFVIVGAEARNQRADIKTAISVAQQLAEQHATNQPFTPPVHVLILPSQVPLDVRVGHVRFMDDELLNGGETPEHMNLIPLQEALDHLRQTAWPKSSLDDPSFLPLGIAPDDVPAF